LRFDTACQNGVAAAWGREGLRLWGVIIIARTAPGEKTGVHFIQADVSTAEGTSKVIREILDRFKGIDIIVHRANDLT
jgi:NAD(P)-dependent dehydrogenase (short-subunit alcohol dehydrogenase family)